MLVAEEWEKKPKPDPGAAEPSDQEYLLKKLKPGGVFIDVKAAYQAQAIRDSGYRLWRL